MGLIGGDMGGVCVRGRRIWSRKGGGVGGGGSLKRVLGSMLVGELGRKGGGGEF